MKVAFLLVLVGAVACVSGSGLAGFLRNKIKPSVEVTPFIVGGDDAAEKSAPYLASLSASSLIYAHGCGAVIISKEWLLTAAHCIDKSNIVGLPVYAGMTNRNNHTAAQVRTVDFAFSHKGFTDAPGSDDIALLHVTPSFELSSKVQPIILPHKNEAFYGETGTAYGWGVNDPEGVSYADKLQVAKSNILTEEECKYSLPSDAPVTNKHICAKVSSCLGDGGSPLVIECCGIVELAGIGSFTYIPCGERDRPTIFTDVSKYISWIDEVQLAYNILH